MNSIINNTSSNDNNYDESTRVALEAISFILTGGLAGRPRNINGNSGGSRRAAQFKQVYYNIQADTSTYPPDFKINFLLRSNSLSIFPNVVTGFPTSASTVANINTNNSIGLFQITSAAVGSAYYSTGAVGGVPTFFGISNPVSLAIPFTENEAGVFADSLGEGFGYENSFDITEYYDKGYVLTSNSKLSELVIQAGLSGFKGQSVFGLLEQYPPSTNLTKTRLSGGALNTNTQFENFKADASISIIQMGNCDMRYLSNGSCNPLSQTHLVKRTNLTTVSGANLNYVDVTNPAVTGYPLIEATSSGLFFVDTGVQVGVTIEVRPLVNNVAMNLYLWADFGYYEVEGGQAVLKFVSVTVDTRSVTMINGVTYGIRMGGYTPNATEYTVGQYQFPKLATKFPSFFVGCRLTAALYVGNVLSPLNGNCSFNNVETVVNVYDRDPEADLQQVAVGYYQGYVGPFTLTTTKSYYVVPNTENQVVLNTMTELPADSVVSDCVLDVCRRVAVGGGYLGEHRAITDMIHRLSNLDFLAASYHIPTYLPWVSSSPPPVPTAEGKLEASGAKFFRRLGVNGRGLARNLRTGYEAIKRGEELYNRYQPEVERVMTTFAPLMAGGIAPYAASGTPPRQYHFPGSSESSGALMPMNPNRWLASGLTNTTPPHLKNLTRDVSQLNAPQVSIVVNQPSSQSQPTVRTQPSDRPSKRPKGVYLASGLQKPYRPIYSEQPFPKHENLTKLLSKTGMLPLYMHYRTNPTCEEHIPIVRALQADGLKVASRWLASENPTELPKEELISLISTPSKVVYKVGSPMSVRTPNLDSDGGGGEAYFPVVSQDDVSVVGAIMLRVDINPGVTVQGSYYPLIDLGKLNLYVESTFSEASLSHASQIVTSFFRHAPTKRLIKPTVVVSVKQMNVAIDETPGLIDGPSFGMALYAALLQLPLGPIYTGEYNPTTDQFQPISNLYYKLMGTDPSLGPFVFPSTMLSSPSTLSSGMSDPTLISEFQNTMLKVPLSGVLGRFTSVAPYSRQLVAAVLSPAELYSVVALDQRIWYDQSKATQADLSGNQEIAGKYLRDLQTILITVSSDGRYEKARDNIISACKNGITAKAQRKLSQLEEAMRLFRANPLISPLELGNGLYMDESSPPTPSTSAEFPKSKPKFAQPTKAGVTPPSELRAILDLHSKLLTPVNRMKDEYPASVLDSAGHYLNRTKANLKGFIPKIAGDPSDPLVKAKMDKCFLNFVGKWVTTKASSGSDPTNYFFFTTSESTAYTVPGTKEVISKGSNVVPEVKPTSVKKSPPQIVSSFISRVPSAKIPQPQSLRENTMMTSFSDAEFNEVFGGGGGGEESMSEQVDEDAYNFPQQSDL